MRQLARGARSGLVQPAHFCTACLAAFSSPAPTIWSTNSTSSSSSSSGGGSLNSHLRRQYRPYGTHPTPSADNSKTNATTEAAAALPPAAADAITKSSPVPAKRPRPASKAKGSSSGLNGSNIGTSGRKAGKAVKASQTQLKLWRETLDVLKKLETAQGRLAEQAAIAAGDVVGGGGSNRGGGLLGGAGAAAAAAVAAAAGKAVEKKGNTGSAGVVKAPPPTKMASHHTAEEKIAAAVAAKEAQEQVKMLTSALHLLKTVLSTQGPQQQQQQFAQQLAAATRGDQADGKIGKSVKKKPQKKKAGSAGATAAATEHGLAALANTATAEETATEGEGNAGPASSNEQLSSSLSSSTSSPSSAFLTKKPLASKKKSAAASDASSPKPFAYLSQPLKSPYNVSKVNSRHLELTPIEENIRPVPRLHYGLDRALFNPGVYHLQDPRSRVFNFDPYLATIMPLQEFDFNALKQYVTSSKDPTLIAMAAKHKMKYSGSTSSMTSMLSHFHFLLSGWRPINAAQTTRSFTPESMSFTRITRAPAATFLHWKDGTYAIDADKEFDTANILSMLGKSMEKLLTLSKEDFEKYRVTKSHELTEAERNDPESFHYTTFGDFMMRSQLDAYDRRLPGSGMFDLKTRAVVSIRMDAQDFQRGLGYEIRHRFGQWESFEREYYDMIRSAFLKYSLQVRMGRMDGIYVAFHNTQRIFGFQYISVNEMDLALHGTDDRTLGDREFMLSLHLLNAVLDKATERFPGRSLRFHIETRPSDAAPFMYVFATPVTPVEIEDVQNASKESVEAFERNILGIAAQEEGEEGDLDNAVRAAGGAVGDDADAVAAEEREAKEREEYEEYYDEDGGVDVWETMRQKVEEAMENEAQGIESVRDTIEDALEQSGLLRGRSPEETREYVDALLEAITRTDTEAVAETILKGQGADADTNVEARAEVETKVEETEDQADDNAEASAEATEDAEGENADLESAQSASETGVDAETGGAGTVTGSAIATADDTVEATTLDGEASSSSSSDDLSKSIIDEDAQDGLENGESHRKGEGQNHSLPSSSSPSSSSSSSSSSPSDTISLKDLIIKLAAQIEAAQTRDAAGSGSSGSAEEQHSDKDKDSTTASEASSTPSSSSAAELLDAPKNKRFERILTEMMASSKESKPAAKSTSASTSTSTSTSTPPATPEIMGMIMTIRNKVNGRYVVRPAKLTKSDSWTVEYAIEEIQAKRAQSLYELLKKRRKSLLSKSAKDGKDGKDGADGDSTGSSSSSSSSRSNSKSAFNRDFMAKLYALSAKGRRFRRAENDRARNKPVQVYGVEDGLEWGEVFAGENKE